VVLLGLLFAVSEFEEAWQVNQQAHREQMRLKVGRSRGAQGGEEAE